MQATFVSAAYGSSNPKALKIQINAKNSGQKSVCQNQDLNKIRSSWYTSVRLFGLYFTFLTRLIIIILYLVIDPILDYSQM
ncbi:hypothetical protein F4678DRAFT_425120, partial [Xylaria arbuscula]